MNFGFEFPYNGGKREDESSSRQVTRYPADAYMIRIVRLVDEKWRKNLLQQVIHVFCRNPDAQEVPNTVKKKGITKKNTFCKSETIYQKKDTRQC